MTYLASSVYKNDGVRSYTQAGFTLFPCKSYGTGQTPKEPQNNGWLQTPYNADLRGDQLPAVFGVKLNDDDLVVDFDPRRGDTQLQDFWAVLGLPTPIETFIVRTGGGGFHIYFKKPVNFRARSTAPGFNAIELKSKGRFVVGAGSAHESGQPYTIVRGTPDQIADAPQELLNYVEQVERNTAADHISTDEGTCQRFRRFCLDTSPAIEGQEGDRQTLAVALMGRDFGLSEEINFSIMRDYFNPRCQPPWEEEDLRVKVANAYLYAQNNIGGLHPVHDLTGIDLPNSGGGEPEPDLKWDIRTVNGVAVLLPTLSNALNYFLTPNKPNSEEPNPLYKLLRYNLFSKQIEFTRPAPWHTPEAPQSFWSDTDTVMLELWLSQNTHFNATSTTYDKAALAAAMKYSYHPVRNWLRSLQWDGVHRLDRILVHYLGVADTELNRFFGKSTLIAAVARIFQPGAKHDSVLVLEGVQGNGKTEFVKILGGHYRPDQMWYADIPIDAKNKDTVGGMLGAWFLEASEMEFNSSGRTDEIKRFLTISTDKVRLPYARHQSILPRESVFIGTINPDQDNGYLKDRTGNRRFWPVLTNGRLKRDELIQDRDQLFAEAYARYCQGEKWWIEDAELERLARRAQEARLQSHQWEQTIELWLLENETNLPHPLTTDRIAQDALYITSGRLRQSDKSAITNTMRRLGFTYESVWSRAHRRNVGSWVRDWTSYYGI